MELTAEHKKKIKKIVAKADKQTMTVKTVRRTLEKSLGLEKDALKPLKEELTAYVTLLIDPPTPAKEKKPPAKKAKPESTEDSRIVQLKKMGQAVRAGPTLFKGLKDLDADARAAELKERLVAKGYEIAGEAPTVSDSAWETNFRMTWSPRRRRCDAAPPRRRRCGRTKVHAKNCGRTRAAAVSRRSVPRRPRK